MVIKEIIDLLANDEKSLSSPFLKTKVFASRIGNKELYKWVSQELNGYDENSKLPDYRIVRAVPLGTLANDYGYQDDQTLPLSLFGDEIANRLLRFELNEGIKALEDAASGKHGDRVVKAFAADFSAMLTRRAQANGARFQIASSRIEVHVHELTNTLGKIRSKLLELLLSIENDYPQLTTEIDAQSVNKASVSEAISKAMMEIHIHTSGDGNVINTGNNNAISIKNKISPGNLDQLSNSLKDSGVSSEDIAEILEVVIKENTPYGDFGPMTKAWITKMLGKAVDGTWQVGISTAGGILVEVLKKYYGW